MKNTSHHEFYVLLRWENFLHWKCIERHWEY